MERKALILVLHNLRSTYNVGAIFRTADGAGVSKIYLTGYTPAPRDRFERVNREIAKTALGAETAVTWEKRENLFDLIAELKKADYRIWALEQNKKSIDYRRVGLVGPAVLIVGNEVGGIETEILKRCDQIIEIPLRGKKESLNVSVAAGVAIFKLLEKTYF